MEPDNHSTFDAIVVGTGPGGATVARELTLQGKKVLMLERGPGGPIRGDFRQYLTELLWPGRGLLVTPELLGMVRGITTGGSSIFYYGTAFSPAFEMLERHGVEIRGEIEETRRELPIGPLKDEMMSPMANRIMDAARQTGFDWRPLDKFMDQKKWRPEFRFGYYGDPHGVKWSARMYVDEAVAGGAVLQNHAHVRRVIIENRRTAAGVEYEWRGERRRIFAPVVVLAAGGIGSPIVLRDSGVYGGGYDFFFDPLITVCGALPDVRLRANEIPMSAGIHLDEAGYMMTDMPVPATTHAAFATQGWRPGQIFAHARTATIMIKLRDSLGGRLTDRGGVRKKLGKDDRANLAHGFENARKILTAAGAKDVYKSWCLAAHPGGTVKIGEMVDAGLKTRIDNLYVCDCSVIPESWGLPPVLTLIGLGKRLARRLSA
ncbi:FAD-dependent oxidoreductase [bacterium]|nr:FAD-dependent oxidoreductase [bacterium]